MSSHKARYSGEAVSTVWPASAVPGTVNAGDGSSVELGVKFRTTVAGSITSVRFYKSPANTGTHTDANSDPDTHADAYPDTHADPVAEPNPDAHADTYPDTHAHGDSGYRVL